MANGSVNKVILIGNLGNDPDVRYTAGGGAVANISLATSDSWRDKQSGEKQERTEWHRVVFFGRLGEIVQEYVRKGSKIYVEGQLRTNKWQDKEGNKRYTTEIIASQMTMLDSRTASGGDFKGAAPAESAAPAASVAPPAPTNTQAGNKASAPTDDFVDDDIPF